MEAEEDPFQYTRAVVCAGVPASLPAAALRMAEPGLPVDLQKATNQLQRYTEVEIDISACSCHAYLSSTILISVLLLLAGDSRAGEGGPRDPSG